MTTSANLSMGGSPGPSVRSEGPAKSGSGLSPDAFAFFEKLVKDRIGVQLTGKAYLIESRLQPLVRIHGLSSLEALISRIRSGDRTLTTAAIEAMTTNETSFFRDNHPFEALVSDILPEMFKAKPTGRIRIWNGACSSGQESYSLAITLHENFPRESGAGRIEILSTDVSREMVDRTSAGSYSRFEINRGMPTGLAQKYFDQQGRNFVAKPSLRSMITAKQHNLLETWTVIPRSDLVLLRNVLIYFSNDVKREILRRIRVDVLNPGGYLILGGSESTIGVDPAYETRRVGQTNLYHAGVTT